VHCCVTSPPYWGLRDYGSEGQLGLEPTPEAYVARMVAVFREVRRVLRADGTCWLNIGDSYVSSPKGNPGDQGSSIGLSRPGVQAERDRGGYDKTKVAGLKAKDLVGIPWRVAFALQADGWYLRSDIVWAKPNPMPESATDRPTKAHEYLFLLTKSARYFYDADAIREKATEGTDLGLLRGRSRDASGMVAWAAPSIAKRQEAGVDSRTAGTGMRNARSVWEIATQPYPEAHFATFPEELPRRCIAAGTSERGCCPTCGAPWERETERHEAEVVPTNRRVLASGGAISGGTQRSTLDGRGGWGSQTVGWRPTCDHGQQPVPCTVLDSFMGSATTALVARKLGRRSIGIELNPDYCALAARRLSQLSLLA
jgi:DNA modification methylase